MSANQSIKLNQVLSHFDRDDSTASMQRSIQNPNKRRRKLRPLKNYTVFWRHSKAITTVKALLWWYSSDYCIAYTK